jgi:beta-phosphoglucomutase-like phosphatase (HAD superfamily)
VAGANVITFPDLGTFGEADGLIPLGQTSDGRFAAGQSGVQAIAATKDRRVEFVGFDRHTLAAVRSALGYPAYYPVPPVRLERPVRAVLMDLDGTTVRSEPFWVRMIELTTASLLGDPGFRLAAEDGPFVAGHSVSEHLQYCIGKYAPGGSLEEARRLYFEHTHREMAEVLDGRGRAGDLEPAPGLADFLGTLKRRGIRIGLVTSGIHEKAWPEIVAVFRRLGLGDPAAFYDAIITAGYPLGRGRAGTLGELSPKPHPWLYAEAARVGLGLGDGDRARVVGLEDSGAGICAVRLAGFTPIGMSGGNIAESGVTALCHASCDTFVQVLEAIG